MTSSVLSTIGLKPTTEIVDPAMRAVFYRGKEVPRTAVSGKGIYLTLSDGSTVIDGVGGAAVCSIGLGDERVTKAVAEQTQTLAFVYNSQFTSQPAEDLADFLVKGSKGIFEKVAFVSGGSEANEAAVKLVRQYWWQKEGETTKRTKFVGRKMSYHGNTLATLSLGHHPVRRFPYEGLVDTSVFHQVSQADYLHCALPSESPTQYSARLAAELEDKIIELGPETVGAFFVEPMVGATLGCVSAPKGYWKAMKDVCEKYGVLLVMDEVMCGMWRMGEMFAYEELCEGGTPDLLTCAKGLGSGYVPIGALLISPHVLAAINSPSGPNATQGHWAHGHTYVGHPVACAGALAVQKIVLEDGLGKRVGPMGKRLSEGLRKGLSPFSTAGSGAHVSDIRGHGLFWAIEYAGAPTTLTPRFATRVHLEALKLGLVTFGLPGTTDGIEGECVMIAPALIVTEEEVDKIVEILVEATRMSVEELKAAEAH